MTSLWSAVAGRVGHIADAQALAATLRERGIVPEIEVLGALLGQIGLLERATRSGRIVWLFNEGPVDQRVRVVERTGATSGRSFDPESGDAADLTLEPSTTGTTFSIALRAQRGAIVWLSP